ncbi:hypothetical protein GGX14DRAFT_553564 [Mycena pura]|uniref:Uncharacterized protein n=1 Tax=Mycena pura TaxID=153505 RepID=A0AAD6YUU9_9AGAR|nr:hypothetical protein GGX14DRAFT_553564 [Mycena pura]
MPHVLSAKSVALGRDTFIFTSLTHCQLGWFLKLTPVSSATVQRWIRTISPETTRELFICPVNVHSVGIFEYWIGPHGSSIDVITELPLPPGDYGLYYNRECTNGGFRDIMALPRKWNDTFEYQANHALGAEERISEYCFLPSITQLVVARDNQCCRFTGRTGDTALSWIFPPVFREQTKTSWFDLLDKDFFSPDNVLTMHTDLKFHFHSNHFTVDIDGDYTTSLLIIRTTPPSTHSSVIISSSHVTPFVRPMARVKLSKR